MDIVISLLITFVLIVVNGYFSMAEMALSTAKRPCSSVQARKVMCAVLLPWMLSRTPTAI